MSIKANRPQQNTDLPYPGKPEQLKLFMTGSEWKNYVTHSTDGPVDVVFPERAEQSRVPYNATKHGSGVYDSMKAEGYVGRKSVNSQPTIVFETSPNGKSLRRVQSEGHHRVAAADMLEQEGERVIDIPTNYVDNTPGARARRRNRVV